MSAADAAAIRQDLEKLGVAQGDVLLMHSSFKSLGPVEGGIATLIAALRQTLGEQGTLLIPTLSYAYATIENPVFDARKTKSCIGAVSEYFRQMEGVTRSLCPTHSVSAIGHYAEQMTAGQLADRTPVGSHSPFARLRQAHGKILMLGCGLEPDTSMHGVEELVVPPYLYLPGEYPFTVIDEQGKVHDIMMRRHNFHKGRQIYAQRYDRILDVLAADDYRQGKVLQAAAYLLDAQAVWAKAEAQYRKDPLYFVDLVDEEQ